MFFGRVCKIVVGHGCCTWLFWPSSSHNAMIHRSHAYSRKTVAGFYNYTDPIDNSVHYTRIVQDRKYVTAKSRVLHPEFRGRMVCSYIPDRMFPVWRDPI